VCHKNKGPCFGLMQLGVNEPFNQKDHGYSLANRVYAFKDDEKGIFDNHNKTFTIKEIEVWQVTGEIPGGEFGRKTDYFSHEILDE
jgi:hypothetical protein